MHHLSKGSPNARAAQPRESYDAYVRTVAAGSADRLSAGLASLLDFGEAMGITAATDPYFDNLVRRVRSALTHIAPETGSDLALSDITRIRELEAELEATLSRLAIFDQMVA